MAEAKQLIKYGDIRSQIQDGDVLLFSGRYWISKIIELFTGKYSHSAIAAWWSDRLMVFESTWPGNVRVVPASMCVDEYNGPVDWFVCTAPGLDRNKVVRIAKDQVGKKYSFRKLFAAIRRFFGRKGGKDPTTAPASYQCTEFVSYCLREGGCDVAPDFPDALTDPQDFERSAVMKKAATIHS